MRKLFIVTLKDGNNSDDYETRALRTTFKLVWADDSKEAWAKAEKAWASPGWMYIDDVSEALE